MVTVAVVRSVGEGAIDAPDLRVAHPKMKIVTEDGDAFTVPYAPRDSTLSGVAPVWSTTERAGRAPLLLRAGETLEEVSFDLVFGYPDPQIAIENELRLLRELAESGERMRIDLDPTTSRHLWRLTGFAQAITARQHGTNLPTRASCSLTFQQASDVVVAVGPLSGGGRAGSPGKKKRRRRKIPRHHVWRKGDTLAGISKKYYGAARFWRQIADANKIRHPRKIKPGRRLLLPRKVRK